MGGWVREREKERERERGREREREREREKCTPGYVYMNVFVQYPSIFLYVHVSIHYLVSVSTLSSANHLTFFIRV